jgi:hypothetical protein
MTLAFTIFLALLSGTGETLAQSNGALISGTIRDTSNAALAAGPESHPLSPTVVLPFEGVFASAVARGELGFWYEWWFPLLCVVVAQS